MVSANIEKLLKSNPSNAEESTTPQKGAVNAKAMTVRVSNAISRVCAHGKEYGGAKLASHYDAPHLSRRKFH